MKHYCHCEQPKRHEKYNFCTKCFHVIYHERFWVTDLVMAFMAIMWFIALVITDHQ